MENAIEEMEYEQTGISLADALYFDALKGDTFAAKELSYEFYNKYDSK